MRIFPSTSCYNLIKGCKGERGYFLYLPLIYVIIEFYVQDPGNSQYYISYTFSS